ncbi:COPI associated protein-domain-containing protein [Chlamydoabsidia padenii]|nr:COPI associated protein-domain-containing protein [Chlamydoabsidia padenii]
MHLDQSLIFRVVNIIVGCFMIIGGVVTILTGGFPQFIRGIYCILFGVMVFLFEFRLPSIVSRYVSFMFSFFGRGVFYIFIGCILLNNLALGIASGVIVAIAGVVFVILQFIKSVKPPSNMRSEALDDSIQNGAGLGTRASNWANEHHQSNGSPYDGHPAAESGGYVPGGNI